MKWMMVRIFFALLPPAGGTMWLSSCHHIDEFVLGIRLLWHIPAKRTRSLTIDSTAPFWDIHFWYCQCHRTWKMSLSVKSSMVWFEFLPQINPLHKSFNAIPVLHPYRTIDSIYSYFNVFLDMRCVTSCVLLLLLYPASQILPKISYSAHIFYPTTSKFLYSKPNYFYTVFVSSHMYLENPEGTQVISGTTNIGYDIYLNTARTRTHNLFCRKRQLIPLGHSNELIIQTLSL